MTPKTAQNYTQNIKFFWSRKDFYQLWWLRVIFTIEKADGPASLQTIGLKLNSPVCAARDYRKQAST